MQKSARVILNIIIFFYHRRMYTIGSSTIINNVRRIWDEVLCHEPESVRFSYRSEAELAAWRRSLSAVETSTWNVDPLVKYEQEKPLEMPT